MLTNFNYWTKPARFMDEEDIVKAYSLYLDKIKTLIGQLHGGHMSQAEYDKIKKEVEDELKNSLFHIVTRLWKN